MGKPLERLKELLGDKIVSSEVALGDDIAYVAPADWLEAARALRDDPGLLMDHFIDITAVDYPLREDAPRFDLILIVRSMKNGGRVRLKTRLAEGESVASLVSIWPGANWGEREVFDMFGIQFAEHPDLRRILMYDEFVGHPLRKDYPIDKTQPLVEYRKVEGTDKLPPFGPDEGQPWSRIDWQERIAGRDFQVSPAIGVQQDQRPTLSKGPEYTEKDDASVERATE